VQAFSEPKKKQKFSENGHMEPQEGEDVIILELTLGKNMCSLHKMARYGGHQFAFMISALNIIITYLTL